MSKSKIKPKEFLQDLDSILDIISKIDNIDISKKNNISKLVKEIKEKEKKIENKYKNLDTKE
jgi:sortase (surface protein transpeptidase)|tara:strand:- start:43 stop:228 length:186 start_codon:yes stop_codon:yes gene_type:complete